MILYFAVAVLIVTVIDIVLTSFEAREDWKGEHFLHDLVYFISKLVLAGWAVLMISETFV